MAKKSQWEILKRPLGYEIALLLLANPKTRREIAEKLPYSNVRQTEYERILESGYRNGIFKIKGTRGADEYYFAEDIFTDDELRKLNERALLRIVDPAETRGKHLPLGELPDDFFYSFPRQQVKEIQNGIDFAFGVPDRKSIYLEYSSKTKDVGKIHADVAYNKSMYRGVDPEPWETQG